MTVAVLSAFFKPLLEGRLPDWIEPRWYATKAEALELAPEAEIGWFDFFARDDVRHTVERAERMTWLNSLFAGVESFPLELLRDRGVVLTNGAGINAVPIAEYVVMSMLAFAKGYREVVRAQDRHDWLKDSPGKRELFGSSAMILGYGGIGAEVHRRLVPFGIACSVVSRRGGSGVLNPDQWRSALHGMDWVIVAVPATPETEGMIGEKELAMMKPNAVVVNIARGSVIDQQALTAALQEGRIGGALLDVTTPEPLPADDPLWGLENAHITMHLSGRAQQLAFQRAANRFVENLGRYERGETLEPVVDFSLGY